MSWPERLRVRPIGRWPVARTPACGRRVASFRVGLADTFDLLQRELNWLRAVGVWLEIAVPAGDGNWRLDGRPRAGAVADHPGVVLVFESPLVPGRELRYATDRFTTWQDNLRAVALGLEALRKVERYGIANRGEQYSGWAQLPAAPSRADRGHELIRRHGGLRQALMATHPDRGGDPSDFLDVQAARDA